MPVVARLLRPSRPHWHPNSIIPDHAVRRLAPRAAVKSPPSAICSSSSDYHYHYHYYYPRPAASVATMSTVAVPQQPLSTPLPHHHHHHHHRHHQPYDKPADAAFDSETPSSSRASSRGPVPRSRNSHDRKKELQPGQASRMSAFFPLGYKEAAAQWVRTLPHPIEEEHPSHLPLAIP